MEKLTNKDYEAALKKIGISYLGSFNQSAKMAMNGKNGVITYSLYLAPATMAGKDKHGKQINVCPCSQTCAALCLNTSGRAKVEALTYGIEHSKINQARIKKTKLFFNNRELFMRMLCYELEKTKHYAERKQMSFSVRLNCTSDISEELFKIDGKNILELYPDVVFYGYTKVPNRYKLVEKYKNLDLTFSYSGINWDNCVEFLRKGINVAVVFDTDECPVSFRGYSVIDMTKHDLRYLDPKNKLGYGFIGYLKFHRNHNCYENGKYKKPNSPFVIPADSPDILYAAKVLKDDEYGE